jgi:mRNA-degrading endonuclease RelE of RelBE toxin-antitoxin system
MLHIEWLAPAFEVLESLPQSLILKVVRTVDLLASFPETGTALDDDFLEHGNYRQLIVNRNYRVIYECDKYEQTVFVSLLQLCRQKFPTA